MSHCDLDRLSGSLDSTNRDPQGGPREEAHPHRIAALAACASPSPRPRPPAAARAARHRQDRKVLRLEPLEAQGQGGRRPPRDRFEVDQNRVGKRWRVTITQNGANVFRGIRRTVGRAARSTSGACSPARPGARSSRPRRPCAAVRLPRRPLALLIPTDPDDETGPLPGLGVLREAVLAGPRARPACGR